MAKFKVLNNGRPATLPDSVFSEWHNNVFDTFEEAKEYALLWLGSYACGMDLLLDEPNKPVKYAYGDTIEIRKVDDLKRRTCWLLY